MIGRNDPCWCGSGKKWKKCHSPEPGIPKLPFATLKKQYRQKYDILLKRGKDLEGIRSACQLAAQILEEVCARVAVGVTTLELDALSAKLHAEKGATPAALHYGEPPFPNGICTSVNEMVCHGIPNSTPLKEGDIVNVDIASILNGYYGDCSKMVVVGKTTPERQKVVDVSYTCLMESIAPLKPGFPLEEVGRTIEKYAEEGGCSVVYQFVGHGVGCHFHEAPQVHHNYVPGKLLLAPGMTFTIEPMINAGVPEAVIDPYNHWEARTADGKASAQWEHTVLITEDGHEILTPWKR